MNRPCSDQRLVTTPLGVARLITDRATGPARATLVLGHGAGGGAGARDLAALAAALPTSGITVVRVEQPWRVAGKRIAPTPAILDRGWLAAVAHVEVAGALVVGGRSTGARVACRTALLLGAVGCVALAFPLHPPGRPGVSRLAELVGAGVPTLVVQGERDAFGGAAALGTDLPPGVEVVGIAGADHGFAVLRRATQSQPLVVPPTQGQVLDRLLTAVRDWCWTLS
jgi:predicted alpha/beta-hydrolase family hydrolase